MPRAQRTKSAGHEALQRRAGERPGDSFSGLLGGASTFIPLAPAPRTPRLKDHRFGAAGAPAPRLRASRPHQRLAESSRPPVVN
jgi:hypothetical protein